MLARSVEAATRGSSASSGTGLREPAATTGVMKLLLSAGYGAIVRTGAPRKPEFAAAAVLLLSVVVVLTSHGHESENSRQGRSVRLPLGNGLYALDR